MDQLAMLWQYQVEDRKADKLEQELSRSPLRQKMNTCRTQFNAKQKQYKQMEEQVAILSDRKDAIRDAITRCEEQLRHLQRNEAHGKGCQRLRSEGTQPAPRCH
mgnify:CR=1 FL=1